MALLRLVQNIIQGFNGGHVTVGVFIEMEKAFDSVWRNGLLAKSHDMGITGKIWGGSKVSWNQDRLSVT